MTATAAGKRERTKRANREALLAAAREVFSDIGYGAASVRDIVRGTDLASGTFYNYFPDKESVLRALVDEIAFGRRARPRRHSTRSSPTASAPTSLSSPRTR
jgi:AcrR family transcriptional regulator